MLENKSHTGKRQSKVITIYNNVCLLFVLSQCDSSVLSSTAALYHMNGSRCKGPTLQFPLRLKCLPSNKNRSQASGSTFFYSQDIVDDYFPAHPSAKISSALYEYKGVLTPLLEGESYMWNGGDVCCKSNTSQYTLGLSPSCFISSLKGTIAKIKRRQDSWREWFYLKVRRHRRFLSFTSSLTARRATCIGQTIGIP